MMKNYQIIFFISLVNLKILQIVVIFVMLPMLSLTQGWQINIAYRCKKGTSVSDTTTPSPKLISTLAGLAFSDRGMISFACIIYCIFYRTNFYLRPRWIYYYYYYYCRYY